MEVNQTGHCCACRLQFRCPVCYPNDVDLYKAKPSRKQEKRAENLKASLKSTGTAADGFTDLIGQLELVRDEQDIEIGELKALLHKRDAEWVDAVRKGIVRVLVKDAILKAVQEHLPEFEFGEVCDE